jgi:callose synthase
MASRGGFAKASKSTNVVEDIFAGFNVALRGGQSKHIEYLQVGKGRDIGMLQIAQYVFVLLYQTFLTNIEQIRS